MQWTRPSRVKVSSPRAESSEAGSAATTPTAESHSKDHRGRAAAEARRQLTGLILATEQRARTPWSRDDLDVVVLEEEEVKEETRAAALEAERDLLLREVERARGEAVELREASASAVARCADETRLRVALEADRDRRQEELAAFERQRDGLMNKAAERLEELQKEVRDLRADRRARELAVVDKEREVDLARREAEDREARMTSGDRSSRRREERFGALERERDELGRVANRQRRRLEDFERQWEVEVRRSEEARGELAKVRAVAAKQAGQLEALEATLEERNDLDDRRTAQDLKSVETQRDKLRLVVDRQAQDLEEGRLRLEEAAERDRSARVRVADLERDRDILQTLARRQAEDLEAAAEAAAALKADAARADRDLAAAREEARLLEARARDRDQVDARCLAHQLRAVDADRHATEVRRLETDLAHLKSVADRHEALLEHRDVDIRRLTTQHRDELAALTRQLVYLRRLPYNGSDDEADWTDDDEQDKTNNNNNHHHHQIAGLFPPTPNSFDDDIITGGNDDGDDHHHHHHHHHGTTTSATRRDAVGDFRESPPRQADLRATTPTMAIGTPVNHHHTPHQTANTPISSTSSSFSSPSILLKPRRPVFAYGAPSWAVSLCGSDLVVASRRDFSPDSPCATGDATVRVEGGQVRIEMDLWLRVLALDTVDTVDTNAGCVRISYTSPQRQAAYYLRHSDPREIARQMCIAIRRERVRPSYPSIV